MERDRLNLQNHLWHLTLEGQLHLAPFPTPPQRVLDVGCGTGIWAMEFGKLLIIFLVTLVPFKTGRVSSLANLSMKVHVG